MVGKVKGVGRAKQQQLAKEGITKVGEIKHAMREKLQQISANPSNSFTFTSLLKIQQNVQCAEPGDVPLTVLVDHRKADNSYESHYGENWKESIKRGPKIKATICITELIEHVVHETKCVFADMNYAGNCFFYHDMLTQMTNKDTKEWMRAKGYYQMWVPPMKGCNAGLVYADQPVGDSPEMMPLDSSLFEDLHAGICCHMTKTTLLPNDNPKKFSLATPKECTQAYTCIFQPSNDLDIPCSRRILEDCKKIITNCKEVHKA